MARMLEPNSKRNAYKSVDEALGLDTGNDLEVAYVQYIRSLSAISEALLEDAEQKVYPSTNAQTQMLIRVAKQCIERVEQIGACIGTKDSDKETGSTVNVPGSNKSQKSELPKPKVFENALLPNVPKPDIHGFKEVKSLLLDLPVTHLDSMPSDSLELYSSRNKKKVSPLLEVQKENEQIRAAYLARMSRTQTTKARANLNLALERRLAENLRLAEAKEKVLQHMEAESRKRILEQAARKIQTLKTANLKEEEAAKQLYAKILEFEQDEDWTEAVKKTLGSNAKNCSVIDTVIKKTLSVPEHPLCKLLQGLQYKIYDEVVQLLNRCPYSLDDIKVPYGKAATGSEVSSTPGVSDRDRNESIMSGTLPDFSKLEAEAAQQLENESNLNFFAEVVNSSAEKVEQAIEFSEEFTNEMKEQKAFHDKLMELHIETKEDIKTKSKRVVKKEQEIDVETLEIDALKRHTQNIVFDVRSALEKLVQMLMLTYEELNTPEGRDQCFLSLEELFFKPLWPYLFKLFRLTHRVEEIQIAQIMTDNVHATLSDFGVSKAFRDGQDNPYREAIIEMRTIVEQYCPLKKLEILVHVAHLICSTSSNNPDVKNTMGADDLIPILCFVVIGTRSPWLLSECHAMEQFIHDRYLMGEEGYCLTSLQTVFHYLKSQVVDEL